MFYCSFQRLSYGKIAVYAWFSNIPEFKCPRIEVLCTVMSSGRKVGSPLMDRWWRKLSRIFHTGSSVKNHNALRAIWSIFCISWYSNRPNCTIGQTGRAIYTASLQYQGKALLRENLCGRGIALNLLHAQLYGNHYTGKERLWFAISLFLRSCDGAASRIPRA